MCTRSACGARLRSIDCFSASVHTRWTHRLGDSPVAGNVSKSSKSILVVASIVFCLLWLSPAGTNTHAQSARPISAETLDTWMTEISNWGRWGADDQLGALNLITDEKRREAAALVKDGVSVSLAHDVETHEAVDNPRPFTMTMGGLDDAGPSVSDQWTVSYHGYAHTHLDALCHFAHQGQLYNGFPDDSITVDGCAKLAITNFKNGLVTRGILIDIPRLRAVDFLEPGSPIYPEELEAWEKQTGVNVRSGDAVFVRTGRWERRAAEGPWDIGDRVAGLHASTARWFRNRDVAVVGTDHGADVHPSGMDVSHPLHILLLVAMGTPIFDNVDLEDLSREAAERERWEFLLTAAPVPVPGGTGSPLNPIATF